MWKNLTNNRIKTNFTIAVEWNDKISQVSTGATSQQTMLMYFLICDTKGTMS